MSNKAFLALLAIGVLVAGFFVCYAWSWLGSIGDPRTAWEAFNYYKRTGVYFVIPWTVLLLIVANVVLWTSRRAWAMWVSYAYFSLFAALLLVWLHLAGTAFCERTATCVSPSYLVGPLLAVLGMVVLGVAVFVDQLVVLRPYTKMYPAIETDEDTNGSSRLM